MRGKAPKPAQTTNNNDGGEGDKGMGAVERRNAAVVGGHNGALGNESVRRSLKGETATAAELFGRPLLSTNRSLDTRLDRGEGAGNRLNMGGWVG